MRAGGRRCTRRWAGGEYGYGQVKLDGCVRFSGVFFNTTGMLVFSLYTRTDCT